MTEKSRIKNPNSAKASLGKQESKRETFAGFVEEFDVARKRKFLKFEYRISRLEISFARPRLAKLLGAYDRLASKIFQPFTKYKILNTKYKQRFVGLAGIIIIIFGSIFLQVITQTKPVPKLQLTDLPYQEKVAEGVWTLKNREPIQQVLASAKQNTDLNLKENKQISNAKYPISNKNEDVESDIGIDYDTLKYRWNVTISSGTKFEFGGIDSNTPDGKVKPEVKITNKEGWFVSYSPKYKILNTKYQFVTPRVKGNIVEWEISDGITARYTMMQDRVKADYIINDKSGLKSNKLEFNVSSGQENPKSLIINPKSLLKGELMPGGDIEWYSELVDSGGQTASQFTFPAPIVKEAGIKNDESRIGAEYEFNKINDGQYFLAVVLNADQLKSATFPLTVDPVVIDSAATATGTAYGNGRKILRDAWGNLIALIDGGTGDDNVYIKDYNSTTWTDEAIDIDGGAGSSVEIAADLDSSNNIHVVYRDTTLADIVYVKITVTRAADNTITSVAKGTLVSLDITGTQVVRPSLIVANKGGGTGVEKVAVAYAMSGVSTRTEARFMQRDVAKENYKDTILATSGLSGYWRLGESSGTNANDESTTANDGTYQASPTLGVAGAIDEDPDTAATFLASSLQYVSVPDNNAYDFGTGNFSLEVWVNRAAVPTASEFILGHSGGNGATDWELYWRTADGFQSRLGTTSCNSGTGADITDSKWHHVVVTMNRAGSCTWYIDGQVSGTPTNISGQSALDLTNTSLLYIGRRNSGNYYSGSLDEVAIYKGVVLTANQVAQHYDAGTYAWKNASEEISGVGTCSDTATSGAAGIPNAATCKGAADRMLNVATATSIHPVLAQIPGKPKRSPASVKKDINGTFTTLTNTIDNNTGTTDDVNSLTTTDYIYVGDDKPFSKATVDITNTNSSAATFATTTVEYCSAQSGGTCTTWTDLSNFIDNSATATIALSEDGSILFDESADWVTATVDSVASKYWIRLRPSAAMDSTVSIAEVYITDRNSKALAVVGGVDSTDDLGASYVPWDEVGNTGWENNPASVGVPWRSGITALDTLGGNWTGYTNFPLSAAVDYKNNAVYVGYVEDTTTDVLHVKYAPNNKDFTVAANWTDAVFPTVTEAADLSLSLTADGSDIYMFYVLDAGTNSLVFRRCTGSGGGLGGICDNASDWGSEKTLDNGTDNTHPQALVTKVTGDTIAIDTIYTTTTGPAVEYERHYVDLMDKTVTVAASGDDAYERNCISGTDDQDIAATTVKLGREAADASCVSSVDSENHIGLRFPSITVAQGAAISSAYVDLRVTTRTGTGAIDFTIYGEDADNSSAFTAFTDCSDPCANGVNTRTKTTSSTVQSVDFVTNTYRIDVTDLVQEIVCRGAANSQPCVGDFNGSGTWASGNALTLLLISAEGGAADNNILAVSQDDTGTTMLDPTIQINLGSTRKNYSLGSAVQLATGSANLAVADLDHPLSSVEYGAVDTDDTNYASVSATTNHASQSAQPAFMFKVNNPNNSTAYKIDASVVAKSTLSTSTKPVHLQVYRGGTTDNWVTMATNNNTAGDSEFTLTSPTISTNTSEYYFNETPGIGTRYAECTNSTANCWTYWRVYQEAPATSLNEVLSIDYVNITFTSNGPDKVAFSNSSRAFVVNACNGAANVFTMELQQGTTPTNPLSTTVVRVTSNASSYVIYSDASCSTPVTNGDFTYTTSQNSKDVYIIDSGSIGTHTLTGTRQSGDTLTTGTQNYTLNETPSTKLRGGTRIRGGTTIR